MRLTGVEAILDDGGRGSRWPRKRQDQLLLLGYLGSKLDDSHRYSEREINQVLNAWHTFGDPALLRRSMIEEGMLTRTPSGSFYWLTSSHPNRSSDTTDR